METGSYLLIGTPDGAQTFFSTAHGSGRTMSRRKARKQWQQELIYYKDSEQLLLRAPKVAIREKQGNYYLQADAAGEKLNPQRHEQGVDVKAVTLHRFSLEQDENGWTANVILDI